MPPDACVLRRGERKRTVHITAMTANATSTIASNHANGVRLLSAVSLG